MAAETKPIATVTCVTGEEATLDAVVARLRFGNYFARYSPELHAADIANLLALQASVSETHLLDGIGGTRPRSATARTWAPPVTCSSRGAVLLPPTGPGKPHEPDGDPAAARPVVVARPDRRPRAPDPRRRRPRPSRRHDRRRPRLAPCQHRLVHRHRDRRRPGVRHPGVGALLRWPASVVSYLFHPGVFLFADGGVLDLGIDIHDSTLNETNDPELFAEQFQQVIYRGVESLKLTGTVCPTGETAATVDVACTGS